MDSFPNLTKLTSSGVDYGHLSIRKEEFPVTFVTNKQFEELREATLSVCKEMSSKIEQLEKKVSTLEKRLVVKKKKPTNLV